MESEKSSIPKEERRAQIVKRIMELLDQQKRPHLSGTGAGDRNELSQLDRELAELDGIPFSDQPANRE
jgi:thiamine pyrophosphate-dependent acetolactate synthase large subunit-like protein